MAAVGNRSRLRGMKRLKRIESLFPNLSNSDYLKYSPATTQYNCLAYAAGDVEHWWDHNLFWPVAAARGEDVDDLVRAFRSQGFQSCADAGASGPLRRSSYPDLRIPPGESATRGASP